MHYHTYVDIRTEQWCYCIDSLCEPESRLRRLFLPGCDGYLLQVRSRPRRHPGVSPRRYDNLPLLFCRHFRHQDHLNRAIILNLINSEDQEEEMESLMGDDGQEEAELGALDAIGLKTAGRQQSK